ncbi:bactofilin family protein [Myroides sp. LJL119]
MFQKTKSKGPVDQLGQTNRIVDQTIIKGDIEAVADLRFDGSLEGNLKVKGRLVIGPLAQIIGNIDCLNADIQGVVKGVLHVQELLHIKETAQVNGEIFAGRLAVDPGGKLEVSCKMLGDSASKIELLQAGSQQATLQLEQKVKTTKKK